MTDAELLRLAYQRSGLPWHRFAREVLGRHPRTMWRYLAGDAMPSVVRERLETLLKPPTVRS